jgi:hypothetical protein
MHISEARAGQLEQQVRDHAQKKKISHVEAVHARQTQDGRARDTG